MNIRHWTEGIKRQWGGGDFRVLNGYNLRNLYSVEIRPKLLHGYNAVYYHCAIPYCFSTVPK